MIELLACVGLVIILFIVIVLGYGVYMFNRLIVLRNRVKNSWAQIDVQLKKRSDLIPNLVRTVKGYAKHEKSIFENVTKARSALLRAKTPAQKAAADNMLTSALKTLFAVAENYPDLKADKNFRRLMDELSAVEKDIAITRQMYNDTVYEYNNAIQTFPGFIFAGIFNFKEKEFFKVGEGEKRAPKVSF